MLESRRDNALHSSELTGGAFRPLWELPLFGSILNPVAGIFHVLTEAVHGAATGANDGQKGGGNDEKESMIDGFHV